MEFCLYGALGHADLDMVVVCVSAGGIWCMLVKRSGKCKNLIHHNAC